MSLVYDEEDDLDELETQSVQSSSRMTARQTALATGLGAEHVQLRACDAQFLCAKLISILALARKKKVMTQAEIAARRSESARKRKHLTEKKLEDDKVPHELTSFSLSQLMSPLSRQRL
jgi:Ino eighty subunit 2